MIYIYAYVYVHVYVYVYVYVYIYIYIYTKCVFSLSILTAVFPGGHGIADTCLRSGFYWS